MSRKMIIVLCMLGLLLADCAAGGDTSTPAPAAGSAGQMQVTSPAFNQGAAIPQKYTCQGEDSSPALNWSTSPAGTKSLALIMDDPDAPGGTWVHWVVYNLPPMTTDLAEGASKANATSFTMLPESAQQGKTSFNRRDYGGPCPPSGTHHYYFRLYALDTLLSSDGLDKAAVMKAMNGHVLAQGELMGTYSKSK